MLHNSTKIIAIVSATSLVVSVVVYGIFLSQVSKQKESYFAHAQERADAIAHKESLQELMKTLDESKEERASLTTRFVQEEEVIDFLALIESIGREQGTELATNSLNVEPINPFFETLIVDITVKGKYRQFHNVLQLFERLPYQTAIHSIQLTKNNEGVWEGRVQLRVTKFTKNES